jgi:hypothetical protein
MSKVEPRYAVWVQPGSSEPEVTPWIWEVVMIRTILEETVSVPSITCKCGRFVGTQAQYEIHVHFEQTFLFWKIDQILLADQNLEVAELVAV